MTQQSSDSTKNIDKTTHDDCSKEYFKNLGQWQGEPLQRPKQLPIEERLPFNEGYSEKIMLALEFLVDIDENHQIHLQLPETVKARKAKVIVLYEEPEKTITLTNFLNELPNALSNE